MMIMIMNKRYCSQHPIVRERLKDLISLSSLHLSKNKTSTQFTIHKLQHESLDSQSKN